jgi:hypothetical protein
MDHGEVHSSAIDRAAGAEKGGPEMDWSIVTLALIKQQELRELAHRNRRAPQARNPRQRDDQGGFFRRLPRR